MLCADGKTNGIGLDALIQKLFLCKLGVGGGGRMDDERFYVGYICKQRENVKPVVKVLRLFCTAFDLKGENRSAAIGKVFLIQRMVRMIGQGGMVDALHFWMVGEKVHNL